MPHYNILSKKVMLKTDVRRGDILAFSGKKATSGSTSDEPAGVAQYEGSKGDIIAITCIGLDDVKATGVALGDPVKVTDGAAVKAASGDPVFAVVTEVLSANAAEIMIK